MRHSGFNSLIWLALLMLMASPSANAESVRLKIKDANGVPLADAVIIANAAPTQVNPEPAIMDQVDKTFVPHVLVVEQGRAVRFPNSDDIRHHVYSFSSPKPFELKLYSGSQQAPVVFDKPGIVALGCNIHDWMIGYIVVSDTAAFAKTNNEGIAVLEIADKAAPVRVWHPRLLQGVQSAVEIPLVAPDSAGTVQLTLNVKPAQATKTGAGFGNRFRGYAK